MVIKREMSLDPAVFEVLSGVGGGREEGGICVFEKCINKLNFRRCKQMLFGY